MQWYLEHYSTEATICLCSLSRKGVLDANIKPVMPGKALISGKGTTENEKFSRVMLFSLYIANSFALFLIILLSGDVHPNPGPSFNHSNESLSSSDSIHYSSNLSIIHINIQSLLPKLEILEAEMQQHDILIFTETWLSPNIKMKTSN